jgi:hypothetical protein
MDILDALINGPKPVTIPAPTAPLANALTLGDLASKTQSGLLDLRVKQQTLDAMSNPRTIALMSAMFGSAGGDGSGMPGMGGGIGVSPDELRQLFSAFPLAMPGLLKQQMDLQKGVADIRKNNAAAAKDYQDVRQTGIKIVGGQANALATKNGDITPMDDAMLVNQALHVGTPKEVLLARPPLTDQAAYRQWAGSLAAAATDPKAQTEIWSAQQKTPLEVQELLIKNGLAPYTAQTERMNAETKRAEYLGGTKGIGTTGQPYQIAPTSIDNPRAVVTFPTTAPAANAPTTSAPEPMATTPAEQAALTQARAADVAGQRVDVAVPPSAPKVPQINLTPAQESMAREAGQEVGNLQTRKSSAIQLQNQLLAMRDLDTKGIYSGGLWGQEGAKKLINVLGGMGYLSKEQTDKLMHTQVFDAEAQQVIADAVSQFAGSRVAARELPFFAGTKPTTQQLASARKLLYGELWDRAQRVIDQADQASAYMQTPDASGRMPIDLGGFTFKPSNRGMPSGSATPSGAIDIGGGMTMRPGR